MSKKVLIISTSPRKNGNSETLADAFLKGERRFKMKSKLLWLFSFVTVTAILLSGCSSGQRESSSEAPVESTSPVSEPSDTSITEESKVEKMNLQIGNSSFTATLESNAAVDALVDMMREAPVVIEMSDYSGFEKVGPLGTSLPTDNKQTTTQSGDIVLYNENQIVIFYGSNSWSYTRLGKIDDLSGWEDALGSGDVTVAFSLK